MRQTTFFVLGAFLCSMGSVTAAAQPPAPASNWNSVKMLAPGTQLRVAAAASKPVQGTLQSVTDTELVLLHKATRQSFERSAAINVSVRVNGHRRRNTLIGLGVGTGAGVAIGAGVGAAQARNCHGFLCGLTVDVDTAVGGAVGLVGGILTGVFWPTGGWRTIYAP